LISIIVIKLRRGIVKGEEKKRDNRKEKKQKSKEE